MVINKIIMEKPIDIIESGEYLEPNCFESDSEAVLFYSYLEQIEYIKFLESKLKKGKEKPPTLIEFLEFAEEWMTKENKDFQGKKTQIITKYETWLDSDWRDGNNKPIKNWRLKFKNTEPHLRIDYGKSNYNNTKSFSGNTGNTPRSQSGKISAREIFANRYSGEIKEALFSKDKPTNS